MSGVAAGGVVELGRPLSVLTDVPGAGEGGRAGRERLAVGGIAGGHKCVKEPGTPRCCGFGERTRCVV